MGLHVLCVAVCLQRVALPMSSYQACLGLRVPYAKVRAKNRHVFAAVGGQVRGLHNLQRRHMVHEGFVFVKFVEIGTPAVVADAVCCSVLRCVAVRCSMLQCDAVPKALQQLELIQRVSLCCGELQCVAVCCSVLQCAAVCCSVNGATAVLVDTVCCNGLRRVVACCELLQSVAV